MGDKILANRAAKEAGVPTVPGHWDQIPSAEDASPSPKASASRS